MARKAIDQPCPNGFPVRLYKIKGKRKQNLVAAVSREVAATKSKSLKKNIIPVSVHELVAANGHAKTGQILKEFGPLWVCKEGKVYFKQVTT